jgi:DNA-binding CsgD family transcriptional regulator
MRNPLARSLADRCRGLLLASRREVVPATTLIADAAATFDQLGLRLEAARSMLALGRALLRGGQRTRAAEALAEARRRFADIGARLWEARAIEELERAAPGRAAGELTTAERRVAALVAEGRTNREIGRALFMGVATVEGHLTRIYRKLDIRSRSELARRVAEGSVATGAVPETEGPPARIEGKPAR